jgi:hypothetical protein
MIDFNETERLYKNLRRYWKSREYRRRMRKLYSNKREMKKVIRKQEAQLAKSFAELELEGISPSVELTNIGSLEGAMEWFLTWRLKLGHYPYIMWCDGVQDLLVTPVGRRSYYVEAEVWIGPEADTNVERLCGLKGTITLNQRLNKLRSYRLYIADEERMYVANKAI